MHDGMPSSVAAACKGIDNESAPCLPALFQQDLGSAAVSSSSLRALLRGRAALPALRTFWKRTPKQQESTKKVFPCPARAWRRYRLHVNAGHLTLD